MKSQKSPFRVKQNREREREMERERVREKEREKWSTLQPLKTLA